MQKIAKCVIATLLMFCFAVNVKAAECTYDKQVELNDIASTVKATYEEVEIDTGETVSYMDPETGIEDPSRQEPVKLNGFKTYVLNVTNDIYLTVKNENTGSEKKIYYKDTNKGTVLLDADELVTYTIKVYGNITCPWQELRTLTFVTPIYNPFSKLEFCNQYPDFEWCNQYITGEKISLSKFLEESAKYKETNEPVKKEEKKVKKSFLENLKEFLKENKKIIMIIVSIVVIVGVTTTAIIVIKRRSRLIWKI